MDDASWQYPFGELPYWEQPGTLVNADPHHLSVIIPTDVNSPSYCVASSSSILSAASRRKIHSQHLAGRIAAPEASSSLIAQPTAGLPSHEYDRMCSSTALLVQNGHSLR